MFGYRVEGWGCATGRGNVRYSGFAAVGEDGGANSVSLSCGYGRGAASGLLAIGATLFSYGMGYGAGAGEMECGGEGSGVCYGGDDDATGGVED